jgi:uncharacterized repeat protein (TIGR03803 family)
MRDEQKTHDRIYGKCLIAARGTLRFVTALAVIVLAVATQSAQAQTYTVLYSFQGMPDGDTPYAGVVQDKAGNLYGTTEDGGNYKKINHCNSGCGTVFKLDPSGQETILHNFSVAQGDHNGQNPEAGLVLDSSGNLYGTDGRGCNDCQGNIFKLQPDGTFKVLHRFKNAWGFPEALIRDKAGNLYGTVSGGQQGLIFKLDKTKKYTVLYVFTCGADGCSPTSGLVRDSAGNLYGTTESGGAYDQGVVFKLDPTGTLTVLHSFNGTDGKWPNGSLVRTANGTLYGTTSSGGDPNCHGGSGCGTVFKLRSDGTFQVLHTFGGDDGDGPMAGLVRDKAGNLYGTASEGGDYNCSFYGCGLVFKVDAAGRYSVVHTFEGGDGNSPYAGLMLDSTGTLYGTTAAGGAGGAYGPGVVFKITSQ